MGEWKDAKNIFKRSTKVQISRLKISSFSQRVSPIFGEICFSDYAIYFKVRQISQGTVVLGMNARFLCILSDGWRDRIPVAPLSFICFQLREKKRKSTKGSRNEESRRREQEEEE